MLQTLNKIKKETLARVGNKFDKDFRSDKNKEVRIILRNSYIIDPSSVEEYIAKDGYFAVEKALSNMKPGEVTEVVKASGLKGRSGGGFPTGVKWGFIPNNDDQK